MTAPATVLLIGLGRIGLPLGQRLLSTGVDVRAWDLDADARARWRDAGGPVAEAAEVEAPKARAVLLCLPTPATVEDLLQRWSRLDRLDSLLVIDLGTASPSQSRSFAEKIGRLGAEYLDAPVTGGAAGAASGGIIVMAGGTPAGFTAARDVLEKLSDTVLHVGPCGSGSQLKAIVQFIYLSYNAAFGLGMQLAAQSNLPRDAAMRILSGGASGHPLINIRLDGMTTGDASAKFLVWRALKDLHGLEDRSHYSAAARRWLDTLEATLSESGDELGDDQDILSVLARYYLASAQ